MKRTPLKRTGWLKRNRMSGNNRKRLHRALDRRSEGWCELQLFGCYGKATEIHHRKLRVQGGDNKQENLLNLCHGCHMRIHEHPARSYANGWLVKSWQDPADVPVKRYITEEAA